MARHTPEPCGAVFRVGANAPASCALRFNHLGRHRDWGQAADDRAELLEALREIMDALNAARRHDCAGFDCATCQPSRLHEIASDAIAKATGGAS